MFLIVSLLHGNRETHALRLVAFPSSVASVSFAANERGKHGRLFQHGFQT